jgi:hypothetical protein
VPVPASRLERFIRHFLGAEVRRRQLVPSALAEMSCVVSPIETAASPWQTWFPIRLEVQILFAFFGGRGCRVGVGADVPGSARGSRPWRPRVATKPRPLTAKSHWHKVLQRPGRPAHLSRGCTAGGGDATNVACQGESLAPALGRGAPTCPLHVGMSRGCRPLGKGVGAERKRISGQGLRMRARECGGGLVLACEQGQVDPNRDRTQLSQRR